MIPSSRTQSYRCGPSVQRRLEAKDILALALCIAYLGSAWMAGMGLVQGQHTIDELPFLFHWLRAGTLALPAMVVAVALGTRAARWLIARAGDDPDERMGRAVMVAALGLLSSLAFAAGARVQAFLFTAHHGSEAALPIVIQMGRDVLLSMPVSLVSALMAIVWLGRKRRLRLRIGPRTQGSLVAASMLAYIVTGSMPAHAATTSTPGNPCPASAPVKHFDVTALDVDIPLNRFDDHDPEGKMYALTSEIDEIRAEERSRAVTPGLHDDAIQPLVIRANEGDCVDFDFTNDASGGDYGIHIDGLAFEMGSSGDAIGDNTSSEVPRGDSTIYRYWIPNDPTLEGAHYLHPGAGDRQAVAHGLFGALIVEPPGSTYLDASGEKELASGWEARIVPGVGKAFREYALLFHEVGDEKFDIPDRRGDDLPTIDPFTGAYRPASKAINYRSEPFFDRLKAAPEQESVGYSSYSFGDPATPLPRAYLGDPTKIRLLHPGGEMFHVFHLHGGGIRWRMNPMADPTWNYADTGLDKHPKTELSPSARLDSQAMGPGESFNLEIEGGAGGVQQAAGEFLFHCHIAPHYVSGMWSFWRVFDTRQPDLAPLPDRAALPEAVNSAELIGKTMPDGTVLTAANLDDWIRPQLPTRGVRLSDQDASVWDWTVDDSNPDAPVYLGEPEDTTQWANSIEGVAGHPNSYPVDRFRGGRPEILFNPENGRPAFPLLRTHLGMRPPFSPNGHSGAPHLGETGGLPGTPGTNPWVGRSDGICPSDAPVRHYNVVAISLPIRVTKEEVDENGKIYVLAEDKADILAGRKPAEPLAIRANIGECVAVTLVNEMPDESAFDGFSKANIHIHHVQFDVQGSDGVITGMNFETSVRPYKAPDTQDSRLVGDASAGDTTVKLADTSMLRPGVWIGVGLGTESIEVHQIDAVDGANSTVRLTTPLKSDHRAGQYAGAEFVQYRWYPDVELDNIFFHDHVDAIHTFGHGLVGQLLIEPRGSTYHDPVTGRETNGAGTYTDIHTTNPLAEGLVDGSFREFALWQIDENPVTDSTFNLRAEPWADRLDGGADESQLFSSYVHGDPFTPLPRAYPGDPFVIRTINVGPRVDTLHIDGNRFFLENRYQDAATGARESRPLNTMHYGVSERFTFILEGGAGGPEQQPGDYLYMNGIGRRFRQGAWGIIRVLPRKVDTLQPLPGTPAPVSGSEPPDRTAASPPVVSDPGDPCPAIAPDRSFDVSAVELDDEEPGRRAAFVPSEDAAAVESGRLVPEPLVLHAAAGDCITVHFTNRRKEGSASFHVDELRRAIESSGANVGYNPEQTVAPGESRVYRFYADDPKLGTALISDFGNAGEEGGVNVDTGPDGLYGAIEVAPAGATFSDPETGAETDIGTEVDVHVPGGNDYRDFTLALSDQDPQIGASFMPYPREVDGPALINYRSAPASDDAEHPYAGTPATPILEAHAGDRLRVHAFVAPGSEQVHSFNLGGLAWPLDPYVHNGNVVTTLAAGPWEAVDAEVASAGGPTEATGDFFYGDIRRPFTEAGMWGILRVLPSSSCAVRPLEGGACEGQTTPPVPPPAGDEEETDAIPPRIEGRANHDHISPNGDGRRDSLVVRAGFSERARWRLRLSSRGAKVWSAAGRGRSMRTHWSGTTARGGRAPDGRYRWRLTARDAFGNAAKPLEGTVIVDRRAPRVTASSISPNPFLPEHQSSVRIRFRTNERASARTAVMRNGDVVARFRVVRVGPAKAAALRWNGRGRGGRLLASGIYRVRVRAWDEALNKRGTRIGVLRLKR